MQPTSPSAPDRPAPAAPRSDSPGVRVPPPVIYVLAFVVGLVLQARFPLPFLPSRVALGVGLALIVAGMAINATGVRAMVHGHGTLNTAAPSSALVTSGPYRYSRNPLYLGLVLLYAGFACAFAAVWALPLVLPLVVYTRVAVIAPEERYLDRTFGDAYRAYRAHVRRWL